MAYTPKIIICSKCGKKFLINVGGVARTSSSLMQELRKICPACENKMFKEDICNLFNEIRNIKKK